MTPHRSPCVYPTPHMTDDGRPPTPHASDREGARPGLRLLVVDDDPLVARILCMVLRGEGHEVVHAAGGRQGIDAFAAAAAEGALFDAVLTDLRMPGVDGWLVAAGVKALSPATPVIVLTGGRDQDTAPAGALAHVDRFLAKPPRLQHLRDALAASCPRPG
jgi:CheY-like chemotaxis protein